jgi:serine/threonine protein phosphatase PrpC
MTVARAFGDFEYKVNDMLGPEGQGVCCIPDVVIHQREKQDRLLILASDGVWDVASNDNVKSFMKKKTETGVTGALLNDVGDALLELCLRKGASDNMSVIVVFLQQSDALSAPTTLDSGESSSE